MIMQDVLKNSLKDRSEREQIFNEHIQSVKEDSIIFSKMVSNLVEEYCSDIDKFSQRLEIDLQKIRRGQVKNYSTLKLELRSLELSNAMYRATDGLSILGSQSDVARTHREEAFAKAYAKIRDGTIPDKKAEANEATLTEALVEKIMTRAYQVIVQKVKSADRILEVIKKIITANMTSLEVFRKEHSDYGFMDSDKDSGDDAI